MPIPPNLSQVFTSIVAHQKLSNFLPSVNLNLRHTSVPLILFLV